MTKARKYVIPGFLKNILTQDSYERWLYRKAAAHVKRDRKKKLKNVSGQSYREKIHEAVKLSKGRDAYTGKKLNWSLLSTYKNKKIPDLPSVDHCHDCDGGGFKICSWAINDLKNDMTIKELKKACNEILKHLGKN